jgi:hypothetical protein
VLAEAGIGHRFIRPYCPQTNGKVAPVQPDAEGGVGPRQAASNELLTHGRAGFIDTTTIDLTWRTRGIGTDHGRERRLEEAQLGDGGAALVEPRVHPDLDIALEGL